MMQSPRQTVSKPHERLQALLPQLFNQQVLTGDAFLRLQVDLTGTTIALPLDCVEETKTLSIGQITPMPNMPPYVLGLMSTKGQVFWAISLPHLWHLHTDGIKRQQYEVAVIRLGAAMPAAVQDETMAMETWVGLVVPKIRGTLRISASLLRSVQSASAYFPPCPIEQIQSVIPQNDGVLWVIDLEQLRASLESSK